MIIRCVFIGEVEACARLVQRHAAQVKRARRLLGGLEARGATPAAVAVVNLDIELACHVYGHTVVAYIVMAHAVYRL